MGLVTRSGPALIQTGTTARTTTPGAGTVALAAIGGDHGGIVATRRITAGCRAAAGNRCRFCARAQVIATSALAIRKGRLLRLRGRSAKDRDCASRGAYNQRTSLCHRPKRSRHHTKDKQRFVVSVVVYDFPPWAPVYDRLRFCAIALRERWRAGPLRRALPSRSSCCGRINFIRSTGHERGKRRSIKRLTNRLNDSTLGNAASAARFQHPLHLSA
jgi:hypothetical protein